MDLIWLIPLVPATGAALNGLFGIRWFSRLAAGVLACAAMAGAFLLSAWAFLDLLRLAPDARVHDVIVANWITPIPLETATGIGSFEVPWALRLDPLSAVMILVVTGIGFLIHVYATAYMKDEPRGGYARFFCYLNLFCFFMLVLVLGGNFLVMFVGWEGVGLCSYLLIGYWYEKTSAADAGKKAFIVNRIGDWGFVLGVFLVFFTFGTLDFRAVAEGAAAMPRETAGFGVLSLICILLFVGATGKSAQIPLYVWLPDAMEGPTPVSALIHAATMVTAGVYMVARNAVLFEQAPLVMAIVAFIGVLTALLAATIGLVQNDIKRVLAYSTVSQLGYMFLATGVGAFGAAIFHLMTHAFFKALLFLGSGSVIHAMAGEQDMQKMGGLKKYMPVTFVTMMIGSLAIAGIPPLAGFFSKDEILYRAFLGNRVLWVLAALTALMTAFYMLRLMFLTFYGPYRGPSWAPTASPAAAAEAAAHGVRNPADAHAHGHAHKDDHEVTHGAADVHGHAHPWHGPHESPRAMTVPLIALAVGAALAGFVGVPAALGGGNAIEHFLEPSFTVSSAASAAAGDHVPHLSHTAELGLMLLSILVAVGGILLARHFYLTRPGIPGRLAGAWPRVHALLWNTYYVDEIYDATAVRGTLGSGRGLFRFDRTVVDGGVNGSAALTRMGAWASHMFDKYVVDGLVNLVGWGASEGSFLTRRLQTGLLQNYALLTVAGVFVFLTVYLLSR
ncbi:NAD(P)H-quinone oxidoreductase subunit 5 [soil metagenome]|nr:NADH-quinone oxidoreductase subunit L [Acidobacteriota bacterium]